MNKKKRRLAVVLATVTGSAVLVLSGCSGKSEQTEKTLRVGVITYSQDDPFINGLTDELKVQLKAMENKQRRIIVSTKSGNDDQQEQNEKVEEMIDAGCDVLCINLVDRTAPSRIVRMARNEDPQDGFIDAGSGGGISWALIDDITHAVVKKEIVIEQRHYHTIKEVKNGEGPVRSTVPL